MASKHSPVFRKALDSIVHGGILAPAIRSYLMDPKFTGFDVSVRGLNTRKPDKFFHPSTHPSWSRRALYVYLSAPELIDSSPANPMSVFSMTAGTIWHEIIGKILCDEVGLLSEVEVPVQCSETGSRGSMDGIVSGREEIFELKTAKDLVVNRIKSSDDYIEKYPSYYLQAQEYMRMSGFRTERVLLMANTFPFEMREFVLDYDEEVAQSIRTKYLDVRSAVDRGDMPECGGCDETPFGGCPLASVCPTLD